MDRTETPDALDPARRAAVHALVEAERGRRGERPLSDQAWVELAGEGAPPSRSALAWDGEHLVAYAHASLAGAAPTVQVVAAGGDDATAARILLPLLAGALHGHGHGTAPRWLVFGATSAHDHTAAALGMTPSSEVLQMHRSLPLDFGPPLPTRPFRVGIDEREWLEVNARAFGDHTDQGRWTLADLRAREAEPWFDPGGFLIHERDGRIAGFCWTKLHDGGPGPTVGEIYVIAADPAHHGTGLGRALVLAGLRSIHDRGTSEAMLFVAGDNVAGRRLYDRLGFTLQRLDRTYRGEG